MTLRRWERVERALDRLLAVDPDEKFFIARDIAENERPRVDVERASKDLQLHVVAQQTGKTRYAVGCEEYGQSSLWRILLRPDRDAIETQEGRALHFQHTMVDAFRRWMKDQACQTKPSLNGTVIDALIETEMVSVQRKLTRLCSDAVEHVMQMAEPAQRVRV